MPDWIIGVLLIIISIVVSRMWDSIVLNRKKMEEDREFVARFLREQFPNSVSVKDISDYSEFTILKVLDILRVLVKNKRVQREGFEFISTDLGNKRYPPKLRLVK